METVNYCLKEFHIERDSVHINTRTDSKVDFKKIICEEYSGNSHTFKTELPAKIVANI